MLRPLINKELKLALHETTLIFMAMVLMLLIPSYPFYVAFFFPCLGLMYLFLNGREQNDVYFTALLPVAKRDVVKARFIVVVGIQLLQMLLSVPVALLRYKLMGLENQAGIEVNPAFYGLVFCMYALFNAIFLPGFYKTAYKLGAVFLAAGVAQLAFVFVAEALTYIPATAAYLDTIQPAAMLAQLPVLLLGLLVYGAVTVVSYRVSAKRFEKLDL